MEPAAAPALPTTQFRRRAGIIDLGWGHPHPAALPTEAWVEATAGALSRYGGSALTYGHATGPGPLLEWLCDRLGRVDGRPPRPEQVFVTAGASHALDLAGTLLCRPGDTVLVDTPTYHLALRILADHRVDLVPAPTDEHGIDPAATVTLVRSLRRQGRRVSLLYLVSTFGNPTGRSLPDDRRAALVEAAGRTGLILVEDDTYRELSYAGPAPDSLFSLADSGSVVRIGSAAKTVAPGLRLGWLTADASLVRTLAGRGYVHSGGGVNHTSALCLAEFGTSGGYQRHLDNVRDRYRRQRDALVAAVRQYLPSADFAVPAGGWFLWLRLGPPTGATDLLPHAEAAGVSYLTGDRFHVTGTGRRYLRLSFSRYDPEVLTGAAARLGRAARAAGLVRPLPGPR